MDQTLEEYSENRKKMIKLMEKVSKCDFFSNNERIVIVKAMYGSWDRQTSDNPILSLSKEAKKLCDALGDKNDNSE